MNKKDFEKTFELCISMLETIDVYIRHIDEDSIEDYMDFYPFIDEHDIMLYKEMDKNFILGYTKGIFLKSKDIKTKEEMFYKFLVSYILAIRYLTDCTVYKPYSFALEMLREFDDLGKISKKLIKDNKDKDIVKELSKLEWNTIVECNFFIES